VPFTATDPEGFREDITLIAQQFKLAEGPFAAAVRHGMVDSDARCAATAAPPGYLLAAGSD